MRPYAAGPSQPAEEESEAAGRMVRLASNENPLGPSPLALRKLRGAVETAHLYPDADSLALRKAISDKFGFPAERVIVGNGSDEIIRLLGSILIDRPDDEVLMADPSFVVYESVANIAPCRLVKVSLNDRYEHDLPAMARKLNERTRIVFLANPNNPTGTIVRREEVEGFLGDAPDSALVVLDEAYFEFADGEPGYPNGLEFVRERSNVVALRTFSKAYGLAGLRCGYGFAPTEVADAIESVRQPYHVNSLAQAACVEALKDDEHLRRTVEANSKGIRRLSEAFRQIGAEPCESFANFVFADLGRPAKPICEALRTRGVAVRDGALFGCPNCMRVTVGSEEEIAAFADALEHVVSDAERV